MMVNPSMVKPLGLSSGTGRVQEAARSHEAALGDVALPDDLLRGVGHGTVGIAVEIAHHAVHLQHLIDVPGDDAVVVPLLGKVRIVVVHALSANSRARFTLCSIALFSGEREEQLVETARVPLASAGRFCDKSCREPASATCRCPARKSFPVAAREA